MFPPSVCLSLDRSEVMAVLNKHHLHHPPGRIAVWLMKTPSYMAWPLYAVRPFATYMTVKPVTCTLYNVPRSTSRSSPRIFRLTLKEES